MYLIDENGDAINEADPKLLEKFAWSYDTEQADFFLSKFPTWHSLKSEADVIRIRGNEVMIPSNYFILIGDYDVGFDIIKPEEIVGRQFQAFTINTKLNSSTLKFEDFQVVRHIEEHTFRFPLTSNLVPIKIGKKVMLVSNKNIYNRVKKLTLSDFM